MVSGSQATGLTCNDYSDSKGLKRGWHDTLSLLTVITKVLVGWIIEPAQLRVCHILVEQSKENAEVGKIVLPYQ